jgi:hypothetical protein
LFAIRFGFGGPHDAVAVGDFSLNHALAEFSLRGVVGGMDCEFRRNPATDSDLMPATVPK